MSDIRNEKRIVPGTNTWKIMVHDFTRSLIARIIASSLLLLTAPGYARYSTAGSNQRPRKAALFDCSPKRLKDGDILTIKMSIPHGRDLGVWGPDGKFYFIVYWTAESSDPKPVVDWAAFGQMSEIAVNTRTLRAPVPTASMKRAQRVFSRPGWYRVLLADNLETENSEDTVNACEVFFAGATRRR